MEWILEASSLAVEQISVAEQMGEKEGFPNLHLIFSFTHESGWKGRSKFPRNTPQERIFLFWAPLERKMGRSPEGE